MYSIIKLMKYLINKITTMFSMVLKDDMETVVENIKGNHNPEENAL